MRLLGCVFLLSIFMVAGVGMAGATESVNIDKRDPWVLRFGGTEYAHPQGEAPRILLVGDSVTHNAGMKAFAENLHAASGWPALVVAAGSASLAHFLDPDHAKSVRLNTIPEYIHANDPDIVVIALGANDARLMRIECFKDEKPYTVGGFTTKMRGLIRLLLKKPDRCVLLVNVTERWWIDIEPYLVRVNQAIWSLARSFGNRVQMVNWNSHSFRKDEWFRGPNDLHNTPLGRHAYRAYISKQVAITAAHGCGVPKKENSDGAIRKPGRLEQ